MNEPLSIADKKIIHNQQAEVTSDPKKELEEFVYIVSHDLNAPLRHVREFAKLLMQRLGDKVSDEERRYVNYMEHGIFQAESMLDGLLQYSRLNTKAAPFSQVDCNEIMKYVKKELKEKIKKTGAKIQHGSLPVISADANQMEQLFYHLVDNSIKFNEKTPEIYIDAQHEDNGWCFAVKDNGIGIPKEHRELVFSMFKRLHTEEEYPGTGAGLGLVKKIIMRHNGTIKMDSRERGGLIVWFTIPLAKG